MTIEITTNHHERELVAFYELPDAIAKREFDYVDPNDDDVYTPRFFEYRGQWWDIHEFERIHNDNDNPELSAWHGVSTQSFYDAITVKYTEDYEHVIVGYARW